MGNSEANIHHYNKLNDDNEMELYKNEFSKNLFESVYQKDGEVEVYGKILSAEEDSVEQISIVSQLMKDYDMNFFQKGINSQYHPYCCEFIVDLKKVTKKQQKMLKDNIGKWLKLILCFNKKFSKKSMIQGILIFSASPIIRRGCCLDFADKPKPIEDVEIKKYEDFEVFLNEKTNEKTNTGYTFLNQINNIKHLYGEIYNVGQGNFIYLKINKSFSMFFDVGESKYPEDSLGEKNYIKQNNDRIVKLEPDCIMLSHWDLDHILGVYKFSDIFYKRPQWVTPDIKILGNQASLSAKRLCAYLIKEGKLSFVNKRDDCFLIIGDEDNGMIRFWQGKGEGNPSTLANNIGLIIEVKINVNDNPKENQSKHKDKEKIKFQKLLFTGDCSYSKMNSTILAEKYDFIVTSHHGAASAVEKDSANLELNTQNETNEVEEVFNFLAPDAQTGARAVISTGVNPYGHPHIEHLTELYYRGFDVYYTTECEYISFSVSSMKRLKMRRHHDRKKGKSPGVRIAVDHVIVSPSKS